MKGETLSTASSDQQLSSSQSQVRGKESVCVWERECLWDIERVENDLAETSASKRLSRIDVPTNLLRAELLWAVFAFCSVALFYMWRYKTALSLAKIDSVSYNESSSLSQFHSLSLVFLLSTYLNSLSLSLSHSLSFSLSLSLDRKSVV